MTKEFPFPWMASAIKTTKPEDINLPRKSNKFWAAFQRTMDKAILWNQKNWGVEEDKIQVKTVGNNVPVAIIIIKEAKDAPSN